MTNILQPRVCEGLWTKQEDCALKWVISGNFSKKKHVCLPSNLFTLHPFMQEYKREKEKRRQAFHRSTWESSRARVDLVRAYSQGHWQSLLRQATGIAGQLVCFDQSKRLIKCTVTSQGMKKLPVQVQHHDYRNSVNNQKTKSSCAMYLAKIRESK